jgi:phage shock protein E
LVSCVTKHLEGIPKDREVVLYCRSGRRSGMALEALREAGYDKVYNAGGYSDLKRD